MVNVIKIATTCKQNNDYSAVFFSLGTVVKKTKDSYAPWRISVADKRNSPWGVDFVNGGGGGRWKTIESVKAEVYVI